MKKFNLKNDYYRGNYIPNVLDIWCQGERIVAYIEGTYVYKVEIIIKNEEIKNYYCSCPSSEGGMSFCKHLSGVVNYLNEFEVLELECESQEEDIINYNLTSDKIIKKIESELYNLIDHYYGRINCYNSSKCFDILLKYSKYIDKYFNDKLYDDAFLLIIKMLAIFNDVSIDDEEVKYQCKGELSCYLDKLIDDFNYKEKIVEYILNNFIEVEISNIGINLIDALINRVENQKDALFLISLINKVKKDDYVKGDLNYETINLALKFIGVEKALIIAKKFRGSYRFNKKIIELLEQMGNETELINELKKQIKQFEREENYEKLLNIFLKNNDIDNSSKLLFEMIIKYTRIEHYKLLKKIVSKTRMNEYRKKIIDEVGKKGFHKDFVLEIYNEDDMINKLFLEIKKYNYNALSTMSKYKEKINNTYHDELCEFYIKNIYNKGIKCYGRDEYQSICNYIKELYDINCSSDKIIKLLESMYPYYKTKKLLKKKLCMY